MRFDYKTTAVITGMVFMTFGTASAWTGPTAAAPGNNASAPINVGSTAQVKNGTIGVNGLAVFGNTLLQGGSYLNFGSTAGSNGYGIWDNGGTLQFRNSGGSWQSLQSIVSGLVGGGSQWTTNGSNIYYNGGNVGIQNASPVYPLETNGSGPGTFGGTPEIYANGDNHTGGGIAISDDGGFYDYNDGWITYNGSTGLKIGGNNGQGSVGGTLLATGNIIVNQGWSPAQALSINSNQIWKSTTTGDPSLYLQYNTPGGPVVIGGQGGATNQLTVDGPTWIRDNLTVQGSATVGGSTVCTTANGACHGSNLNWNWAGQGGQPTWLWGSNDGTNMYVWNPSNFSVNYANSAGNANTTDGYSFNQWVTYGASPTFGAMNLSGQLTIQGALNINGNQMWTNSGTLYLNYSNSGGEVDVGNSNNRNNNFVDWGNVYSSARGAWMSEMARDDGGQFAVSGNTCPSGSLLYGFYAGGDAGVCSRSGPNGSCQQLATDVSYCQWIN